MLFASYRGELHELEIMPANVFACCGTFLKNGVQLLHLKVGDIVTHINDETVLDAEQAFEPARCFGRVCALVVAILVFHS